MTLKKKKIYDVRNFIDVSESNLDETPDNGIFIKDGNNKVSIEDGIESYNIHELDPHTICPKTVDDPDSGKYVIIGKPGTGKSVLARSLLYAKKHIFPCGQFFSGTEDSNFAFSEVAPNLFIDSDRPFKSNSIEYATSWENFEKRQKIAIQYLKNPWCVRMEDDCSNDSKIFNKPTYHNVFKNGRRWKMMYMLLLQYAMDIKPVIRTCIDGTFVLREQIPKNRKTILENYVPCVKHPEVFDAIMDVVTADYTSLFVNNKTQSNNIEDILFYYKADFNQTETLKKIKFGSDSYWAFSDERCK